MNTNILYDIRSSALGLVLVATGERGICAILIGESERVLLDDLRERFDDATVVRDAARLAKVLRQVIDLMEGRRESLDIELDARGTAFQHKVWRALREIPRGKTASYAEIARRIRAPRSFRAVAAACGANPIALAIPCHRVVRNDGGLSGYRWGVERKRALLEREGAIPR